MSRRTVDLNGNDWWLLQAPDRADPFDPAPDEWGEAPLRLPAAVPGDVHADLRRAGRLPDLELGRQSLSAAWVNDHCWWLVRDLTPEASPGERAHLVLHGVDYVSTVFLNGHLLGRHEGMFSAQVYDVTALLRPHNRLAVHLLGARWLPRDRSTAAGRLLNHVEARVGGLPGPFPHRRDTLKCQMGFGWDFAPSLPSLGIWDDVSLVLTGDVFIRDVAASTRLTGDGALLTVAVELDAGRAVDGSLRLVLAGETFDGPPLVVEQPAHLAAGTGCHTAEWTVPAPRLWWPWDHGRPDLYRLTVEAWSGGLLQDSVTRCVGLRQVELDGRTVRVNGQRVFARGANWVPAGILPGCVADADYHALLTLARGAHMNMLRVWGGGLREKRAFYELCDRLGILVWQEFPFACAFLTHFPRRHEYLDLVEAEVTSIVRALRNHPSVVLWCGGNEFHPRRNAPLVRVLRRAVAEHDPTRPFVPASPGDGDHHNWRVWHHFCPPADYRHDTAAFAGELGLQAPPDVDTLRRFIPPEELWPPGPSWTHHGAGLDKLRRYARPYLPDQAATLDSFVQAGRRAQAAGLQVAVEHFRRRKALGCGGVLIWQLNEPWPAVSWAVVDFYRRPKPSYDMLRRLFTPCLVSLDYPLRSYAPGDPFRADVWVVNDRAEALPGCLVEAVLWDTAGRVAGRFSQHVDVAGDSAAVAGSLRWNLPPGGGWRLACRLTAAGQVLSANEYDLSVCDDVRPTALQRLHAWIGSLASPG